MDDKKDGIAKESTNRNPSQRSRKKSRKQDTIIMLLLVMVVLLMTFCVYVMIDKYKSNEQPEIDPKPLSENDAMTFEFNLTSSGRHAIELSPGDTFTVVYRLYRNDEDSDFVIYAVQNEIEYDSSVFELIEDTLSSSYNVSVHDFGNNKYRVFMNAFSTVSTGFEYKQGSEFGSFTLRVRDDAPSGSYDITSNDCGMSAPGGYAVYSYSVKDLTVTIAGK